MQKQMEADAKMARDLAAAMSSSSEDDSSSQEDEQALP
jgi:hypothetical protein